VFATRRFRSPHTTSAHMQFLSNGRYTTALTHTGGGFSAWRDIGVTRRRPDRTVETGANFIYLRDPWSGRVWSPTYHPIAAEPDDFETTFDLEKATYRCSDGDFEMQLQVTVSPEDDVEVRRLSITNRSDRQREVEVTSYAEIVLARPEDDFAHPAFGKLFIETEFDAASTGILFSRRPRGADEAPTWVFHGLGVEGRIGGAVEWETDRARFIGRGRTPSNPIALDGRALSGTTGAVLDPVAAIRERVRLAPGAFVRLAFTTGVAPNREMALALLRKYRDGSVAARALSMAIPLVRQLLHAQEYWRLKGLRADLVILNEHPAEYLDETQQFLSAVVQEPRWSGWNNTNGGMFLLRRDGMADVDFHLLSAVARVVLRGDLGGLASQLDRPSPWLYPGGDVPPSAELRFARAAATPVEAPPLVLENGLGGFTHDGREYVIVLDGDRETPLPWSNVMANASFGTMVSASGSAFTWAGNSRENRLTPFANDPIGDPTGEAIYLRDEDSGEVWGATPSPLPRRADAGRWVIRHAAGVTRYQHALEGLTQQLEVFVSPRDPVKIAMLTLTNTSPAPRRLSVFGYVEWCLGPPRMGERRFVVSELDAETGALLARNPYNVEFAGQAAFLHATEPARSFTGDRGEFIGRDRTLANPAALLRPQLGGRVGPGLDPCGALQLTVAIEPGETRRLAFVLGHHAERSGASALAARYASLARCETALADAEHWWTEMLGAVQVTTPDDSFDLIVNRWLPY